jgi:cellulose synthase/poly-beta-1,6-N-acetylglucosamine synthase-like glycosyltransferase
VLGTILRESWQFLHAQSFWGLVGLLWLTLLAELPRYFVGIQATAAAILFRERRPRLPLEARSKVSVLLVGHNEENAIEKCVRSLRAQTFRDFEIICVDDGSSDSTYAIMCRLHREQQVHAVARLQLRGGKASGLNLAARMAKGDIYVVVDCDCSFEPDAIEELIRPLMEDPKLSAVSGNILVRNWQESIVTSLQAIEYLQSISLGKSYANILDQVSCVSGAWGAFRRRAWEHALGNDPGGGEDLDFTIRLRLAGYRVAFTRHAICYTDAPATLYNLLRQRNRWERDAFWIRFRKYRRIMNPLNNSFSWRDALHQWDFVIFNMLPTMVFPFYIAWLLAWYGDLALIILMAVAMILLLFDVVTFVASVLITGKPHYWWLLPFVPIYGLFQSYVMRIDRFYAYASEWIYSLSRNDNYVPQTVRNWSNWR